MQQVVRDDHTVAGSETVLDPFGEVQCLLDADQRIGTQTLGFCDLFHHEGSVAFSGFLHLRVVPGQVLSRITAPPPQRFLSKIGSQLVSVGALLGIR